MGACAGPHQRLTGGWAVTMVGIFLLFQQRGFCLSMSNGCTTPPCSLAPVLSARWTQQSFSQFPCVTLDLNPICNDSVTDKREAGEWQARAEKSAVVPLTLCWWMLASCMQLHANDLTNCVSKCITHNPWTDAFSISHLSKTHEVVLTENLPTPSKR